MTTMAERRQLLIEIDRTFKLIAEGLESFDEKVEAMKAAPNKQQKEKHMAELKEELKKLQRYRAKVMTWTKCKKVKDKRAEFEDQRLIIETRMETYGEMERADKTKPFSEKALEAEPKIDPIQRDRDEVFQWLRHTISILQQQMEPWQGELERLSAESSVGRTILAKIEDLWLRISQNQQHAGKLELIMRYLHNDSIAIEDVKDLRETVEAYVDSQRESRCAVDIDYLDIYDDILESVRETDQLMLPLAQAPGALNTAASIDDPEEETHEAPMNHHHHHRPSSIDIPKQAAAIGGFYIGGHRGSGGLKMPYLPTPAPASTPYESSMNTPIAPRAIQSATSSPTASRISKLSYALNGGMNQNGGSMRPIQVDIPMQPKPTQFSIPSSYMGERMGLSNGNFKVPGALSSYAPPSPSALPYDSPLAAPPTPPSSTVVRMPKLPYAFNGAINHNGGSDADSHEYQKNYNVLPTGAKPQSIMAVQRQKRKEAAVIFQKKLEEKRTIKVPPEKQLFDLTAESQESFPQESQGSADDLMDHADYIKQRRAYFARVKEFMENGKLHCQLCSKWIILNGNRIDNGIQHCMTHMEGCDLFECSSCHHIAKTEPTIRAHIKTCVNGTRFIDHSDQYYREILDQFIKCFNRTPEPPVRKKKERIVREQEELQRLKQVEQENRQMKAAPPVAKQIESKACSQHQSTKPKNVVATFHPPQEKALAKVVSKPKMSRGTFIVSSADEDDDAENSKYLDASEIGEVIRQSHKERDDEERKHEDEAASKIQCDEAARRIQSFYRKQKPQHDYQALMNSSNLSLCLVQKFANLLNETDIDYEEELEIERLRKAIREEIRQHKKYEKQLDELDLQIGLLVRNRINLEKMPKLEESGSMKRASMTELNGENRGFGFDLLSKPGRQRLHAYQNLLYFLTRNPKYLSSLLVSESASDADQFTESVILPLFNHGTGFYDDYLLVRFFKTAMEMEMDRMGNISELQAVNLVSIDQLIKFIMSTHGDQYKRDALQQLLTNLLSITDFMETDPVEVYQRWIADLESRTGRSSDLPLDLTAEQALVHPEVKEKIHESVVALKRWVADFLDAILGNVGKLPYCLRYFCKALRSKLIAKFPHEKLGTVSMAAADNLFHRFIQACVALQNRMVNEDDERSKRQRQATANVVKLLRCVMVNKGYNQEHPHLMEFNTFIKECHQRFKNFFNSLCDVPELEECFQVDEYVDYVMPTKPSVIMQLGDLIKLHQLLVDHRTAIASGISDPLHELLNDLGSGPPSISDIVGDVDEGTRKRAESADLVLNLTDKFEVPSDAKDGIRYEFLRTKKYLIDIILVQRAPSVDELLSLPVSAEEEKKHKKILDNRRQRDQEIEGRLTLVEKKAAVLVGLATLEEAGLVSRSNDYRDIIAAIAKDIRTRSLYRENRARERARLLAILEKLKQKSASYRERIEFYDQCCNSNSKTFQ